MGVVHEFERRERRKMRPGDIAPQTGVYRVIHRKHRGDHLVVAITGEVFPSCRVCRGDVRFSAHAEVEHVTHDWDLSGPSFDRVSA